MLPFYHKFMALNIKDLLQNLSDVFMYKNLNLVLVYDLNKSLKCYCKHELSSFMMQIVTMTL